MPDYSSLLLPFSTQNWNFFENGFPLYTYLPNNTTTDPNTGLDYVQVEEVKQAKTQAQISGNFSAVKLFDGILKYGIPTLLALGQAGVWKNKNITSLAQLAGDEAKAKELLLKTSGDLSPDAISNSGTPTTPRSTETQILGIPMTYIIVGLVAFAMYMLFKEPSTNKQKNKR